jgi:5-(carboxyamino)imidazole ribonucleotide synthase
MMRREPPLPPGSVIGILGGGQLGRMLALAAARLGLKCHIFAPNGDNPAFEVAYRWTEAPYEDHAALAQFARSVSVVTYEFENVPVEAAATAAAVTPLHPSAAILEITQDRLREKSFVRERGIGVPDFLPVSSVGELEAALDRIGRPAVLKSRRLGYDGKGQAVIRIADDAARAFDGIVGVPAIVEAFVPFAAEISVIGARGGDGAFAAYDIPQNHHRAGILRRSVVPAPIAAATAEAAKAIAMRLMADLNYVGVMAAEMFVIKDDGGDRLLVNEIAPRVHNSGHWTIDACAVSQFEQHIRAIAGWPLGAPARHSDAVMENLIGDEVEAWPELAAEPRLMLHIYGKSEIRPGRKMGHFTRLMPRN